jgi:hypothetical protein
MGQKQKTKMLPIPLIMDLPTTILDQVHAYTFLRLSTDDLQNTHITTCDGSKLLYTVSPKHERTETIICKAEGGGQKTQLARFKLTQDGGGKIAFGDGEAVLLGSWLRKKHFEDLYVFPSPSTQTVTYPGTVHCTSKKAGNRS